MVGARIGGSLRMKTVVGRLAAAAMLVAGTASGADPGGLAGSGVTVAPADAAFFFATLRGREQYQRFAASNAYKALEALPGVKRAFDSLEEQRTIPGSPLSMVDAFLQLPENAEAVALLADLVATDTFLYGEPSCIPLVRLFRKLQQARQAAGLLAPETAGGLFEFELELDADDGDEEDDDADDEDDSEAAAPRRAAGIRPVRLAADVAEDLSAADLQKRLVARTLTDNAELIVVPDLVWGFKTSKRESGAAQLARLEALAKLLVQTNPALGDAVKRKTIAGGPFLTFSLKGDDVPWGELSETVLGDGGDEEEIEAVMRRLKDLDLVVALGMVGDWVILSVGDSTDHLAKLAIGDGKAAAGGLLAQKAFAPLLKHRDRAITGISYVSGDLATALAASKDDFELTLEMVPEAARAAGYPEAAATAAREWLSASAEAYAARLPEPGPALGFAFLGEQGYEGYAWDWTRKQPLDGGRRLDLLEHAGGAPLAVFVTRLRSDPRLFDDLVAFVDGGLKLLRTWGLPDWDEEDRATFLLFDKHVSPLGGKLVTALRDKILPSLADGQVGFVIDAKVKTKRPQKGLPASAEPLPLLEPAIVLPLGDAKLFREGLNDLFALGDEFVEAVRDMAPDAVPPDYRVPDPEKSRAEGGTVWSFALPGTGIDDQVRPSIGVGEKTAVFSLVPAQAARVLVANRLETGAGLAKFEEPLASAAALDGAGIFDAIKPWVWYLARYGCAFERESGQVDPEQELSAEDENERAKEALRHAAVVIEVLKCFRAAVAETSFTDDALVTHWRNVFRDLPAKR